MYEKSNHVLFSYIWEMVSVFFGRPEECNESDLDEQRSVSRRQEGLWRSVKESGDPVGCRGSDIKLTLWNGIFWLSNL